MSTGKHLNHNLPPQPTHVVAVAATAMAAAMVQMLQQQQQQHQHQQAVIQSNSRRRPAIVRIT
jgi:hypothetical protein